METLVTGASGYIGSAVVRELHAQGVETAACARDLARAQTRLPDGTEVRVADYEDLASLAKAFLQVERLLFIPSDGFATTVRRHTANVIEAARESGVGHLVFLSIVDVSADSPFYYAPVYRDAEARLAASGIPYTLLRSSLYADFIHDAWLRPSLISGTLSLPAGSARVAPITRDDVALAAATALTTDPVGETFTLTGPEPLSFEDLTRITTAAGAPLTYNPIAPTDYLLRLWSETEDPWPHAFSTLLASIVQGRFSHVSEDFQRLTGQTPGPFERFIQRQGK